MSHVIPFRPKCVVTQEELALFRCSLDALRSIYTEMERRRDAIEEKITQQIPQEPGELVYVPGLRIVASRSELKAFG